MRLLLLLIISFMASCGIDNAPNGNDVEIPNTNVLVQDCSTSVGDSSITGLVTLVSSFPLTDSSFSIILLTSDSYSTILSKSCITGAQTNPFNYQIFYNNQDIYANNTYLMSVSIHDKFSDGNYYVRDISTFSYPVLTNGSGNTIDMYTYNVGIVN